VELSDFHDGPLFLLVEAMATGIRQFLTFEQQLQGYPQRRSAVSDADVRRDPEIQEKYFDGLEILRGHLSRCLSQICLIAGIEAPKDGLIANYQGAWQIDAYEALSPPDNKT
jgi:hypothetical protein